MTTIDVSKLANVKADYLTSRMQDLRRQERQGLAEFLACLGEMERRRLHLELGFGSIFAYLVDQFGYDKASAYRRWKACGLVARFPILVDYIADGRLGLITLVLLRDVLDEARLDEILGRAAGRTVEEVERLVAALAPDPAPAEMIRKLPPATPEPAAGFSEKPTHPAPTPVEAAPAARPATIEPINAAQHVVRFTVDDGFLAVPAHLPIWSYTPSHPSAGGSFLNRRVRSSSVRAGASSGWAVAIASKPASASSNLRAR